MKKVMMVALCAVLALSGCKKSKDDKSNVITYTVTNPQITDTSITQDYVTHIQSFRNIEIHSQAQGYLEQVCVSEGQTVKAGQVLFKIMPQMYEVEKEKSKAELEQANIEWQNTTTLTKNNIVSKSQQAMAKAKVNVAQANLKLAQLNLKYATIRAPYAGVINEIPMKVGSLVNPGDLLTKLSDNSSVYAYFNVSEPEYLDYEAHAAQRKNERVSLILANGATFNEPGHIQNIDGDFDSETGSIAFRAQFPNPQRLLRNGETGKIRMTLPLDNAMLIPQKSTYEIQDQKYVFVVDKEGIARSRAIQVSYELPYVYVVSQGLQPNDRILVDGTQKVKDGEKLKVVYKSPAAVMRSLQLKAS